MTTPYSPFLQLPPEIIILITTNLPPNDILRLSETCQLLYKLVQTSTSVQYQIEREVANVVHGESCLSSAECLALLKKTEYNWATLRFSRVEEAKSRQGNLWELFGGVLAFSLRPSNHSNTYEDLSFIELPSTVRATASKTLHLTNLESNIRDFGMDPAQDLLVIIEVLQNPFRYRTKLLTMSTGRLHPLASQPILSCSDIGLSFIRYNFVIQVMGDYLGVLLHTTLQNHFIILQDQFLLWNWKTGHKVLQLSPRQENIRYDCFSFISPNHLVISRLQPHPDTNILPYLEIYDFSEFTRETILDPHPYRTFELPELNEDVIAISVTTRSDPSPGCFGVSKSHLPSRPFTTSPKSRLLTICVELISHLTEVENVMFFVHQESLLSMPRTISLSTPLDLYRWDSWGPRYSRALRLENHHSVWVCYVHGTRFVRAIEDNIAEPQVHRLQIMDFNPLSIRRYGNYGMENIEIVDWETVIPRRLFARDITTSLPYRRSTSVQPFPHTDFMIDEDVVIGLRRAPDLERDLVFLSV